MTNQTCSVADCTSPLNIRGLCNKHYQRLRKHGDVNHERAARRVGVESCAVDGCDVVVKARGVCGKHLHRLYRHGSATARVRAEIVDGKRICADCTRDVPLSEWAANGSYCLKCAAARRRAWVQKNPQPRVAGTPTPCEWCGTIFPANKRQFRVCSSACKVPAQNRRNWKHVQKRRARLVAALVEAFSAEEIYERDSWTCQLCMKPLRTDGPPCGPLWPSIDHIIPLSRGGTHERANVQAAHLSCNVRKGARLVEEMSAA